MKAKTITKETALILALPILSCICLIFQTYEIVDKVCLILTFADLAILAYFYKDVLLEKPIYGIILEVNVVSLLITNIFTPGIGISLLYINLLLMLVLFRNLRIDSKQIFWVYFVSALLLNAYIFSLDGKYLYAGYALDLFGVKVNSNSYGLLNVAALLTTVCFISFLSFSENSKMLLSVGAFALYGYLILSSSCRSALLALLVFLCLFLFQKKVLMGNLKWLIVSSILFASVLFTVVYIHLPDAVSKITFFGKEVFTGREGVWEAVWEQIISYPIFGSGTTLEIVWGEKYKHITQTAHNFLLGIWKNIGLIPMLTLMFCFVPNKQKANEKPNRLIQIAFLSTLIVCFFEGFYSESRLYVFFALFFLEYVEEDKIKTGKSLYDSEDYSLLLVWKKRKK